jgi:putative flippase GtrA
VLKALVKKLARPRLMRFAVVGLSGVFVNLGMLAALADGLEWPDVLSSAVAIEVSILWNFLLNNAWTFKDRNATARIGFFRRMGVYNLVSLVGLGIQLLAFIGMNHVFVTTFDLQEPGLWKYPSQLVGIAIAMAWNFLSNFYFTWAQAKAPAPEAPPAEDEAPANLTP